MPYSQMGDLRVVLVISRMHPEFLDFDIDAIEKNNNNAAESIAAVDVATAATVKLNDGLNNFHPMPKYDLWKQ